MKRNYLKHGLIYIIISLAYYLCPFIMFDTGSGFFMLLFILPLTVFISSLLYAKKLGFKWYLSFILGLLWLPNIFVLNDSALVYAFIYGGLSFLGQVFGYFLRK